MTILYPLVFTWKVSSEDDDVKFSVTENKAYTIHDAYYSRGKIPPLTERIKYARYLGASESKIKSLIKNHMQAKKDSEKNQKIVDDLFARFNIKPTKKKVLKPVKKMSSV